MAKSIIEMNDQELLKARTEAVNKLLGLCKTQTQKTDLELQAQLRKLYGLIRELSEGECPQDWHDCDCGCCPD